MKIGSTSTVHEVDDQAPRDAGGHTYTASVVQRKVFTKGSGGVTARVVVIAQRGQVWMSIEPAFTWEAIMEPEKVDELMRTLGLAREDAKKMAAARAGSVERPRRKR